jgi:hypothetical protein
MATDDVLDGSDLASSGVRRSSVGHHVMVSFQQATAPLDSVCFTYS